jgi:hypothetical protein
LTWIEPLGSDDAERAITGLAAIRISARKPESANLV